jgi:hypothetical protein
VLPKKLFINAFTGDADGGSALHSQAECWIGREIGGIQGSLRPEELPDLSRWDDSAVGWGIVLPEHMELANSPVPIQKLVKHRGVNGGNAPVFHYVESLPRSKIRRVFDDASCQDPDLIASPIGIGAGAIPQYLLIYGSPQTIPWEFQYIASANRFVGRLDLEGDALENYVTALIDDWNGAAIRTNRTVTWAVDHGEGDITHLMRRVIAYKMHKRFSEDNDIGDGAVFLDGRQNAVTCGGLIAALAEHKPGMITTSSHGMTGPLGDVSVMAAQLGLPVDAKHDVLDFGKLLQKWSPNGAIWYAHACCSAGADKVSKYNGLVAAGSYANQVLKGVEKVGSCVSPLPRALLGAPSPLRAFIGHVEPTFDWTMRDRHTGQIRTNALIESFYNRLYQPMPLGRALEPCHEQGPKLDSVHKRIKKDFNRGIDRLEEALECQLIAQDLESLVILGDPTVVLPTEWSVG